MKNIFIPHLNIIFTFCPNIYTHKQLIDKHTYMKIISVKGIWLCISHYFWEFITLSGEDKSLNRSSTSFVFINCFIMAQLQIMFYKQKQNVT